MESLEDRTVPSATVGLGLGGPPTAQAGGNITYTIMVGDEGPDDAQNFNLTDLLPSSVTFVSQAQNSGPAFTLSESGGQVSDTIATLPAMSSASFAVVGFIPATTPNNTLLPDSAYVLTTTQLSSSSTTMASTSTTVQNTGQGQADLAVTNAGPSSAVAGTQVTYTVTVSNAGPNAAQGVTLADALPSGTAFVSQSQTSGPLFMLSNSGNQMSDTVMTLPAGTSATFSVTASIGTGVADGSVLSATATVSSSTTDPNSSNNTSTASTTVNAQADLAVTATGPATALAGDEVSYTVTVTNNGPSDAQAVTLDVPLPDGLIFLDQSQTSGTTFALDEGSNEVLDSLATLPFGASATFGITAQVDVDVAGGTSLATTATVSSSTTDPSSSNNSATTTLTVNPDPPTVAAGPSQTVHAGDTVTFDGTVTDPEGPSNIASIQWDFNYDGTNFNADAAANGNLTPTYSYATPGTYLVAHQATDLEGDSTLDVTSVVVKNAGALLVNAGPDQGVTPGASVSFSGSYSDPSGTVSAGGIAWDFNYDGSTFSPEASGAGTLTPSYTFSAPGTYAVALSVTDSNGVNDLSVLTVTVANYVGPTASAGSDQMVNEGDTAAFSGSYTDPDGTVSSSGIAWDFNYDGSFNADVTGTLTPSFQFLIAGQQEVALQVTDSNGLSSLSVLNVTVNAVDPTVNAGSNVTTTVGTTVAFAGSFTDVGGTAGASFAWDFNYDGSNFVADSSASNNPTPSHQFTAPGTYLVAFRVTTGDGEVGIGTAYVSVANPTLDVVAGPDQAANAGDTVTFQGSATDSAGSGDIASIQWDFNYDGTTFNADPSANGTLTPAHQFTAGGTYEVALQVTDVEGDSALSTLMVTVNPGTIGVNAGSNQSANEGDTVSFNGSYTLPSGAQAPVSVDWDFNYDGSNFIADPTAGDTLTPSEQFMTPGTYTVALQVTDGNGDSGLSTLTVVVANVAPTANAGPAQTVNVNDTVYFQGSASDPGGPGDITSIQWDFNYNGTFSADPSAAGTYTPTHVYTTAGTYAVALEVTDDSGATGLATTTVTVVPAGQTVVANSGTGTVLVNGSEVDADQYIVFAGEESVSVVLETSGADYDLQTNSSFTSVSGSVTGVTLTVDTTQVNLSGLSPATGSLSAPSPLSFFGPGNIGEVDLPGGGSTLALYARGDLGSIVGPSMSGTSATSGAGATDLYFANLTGSITGLDSIDALVASGWLGQSEAQQVTVNSGIESLTAYGIGATVTADANFDGSDPDETVFAGAGGVPGVVDMGNLAGLTSFSDVNEVAAQLIKGSVDGTGNINLVMFEGAEEPASLHAKDLEEVVAADTGTLKSITAGHDIKSLTVKGPLKVLDVIKATNDITSIKAKSDLVVDKDIIAGNNIGSIVGDQNLIVGHDVVAEKSITKIEAKDHLSATNFIAKKGNIGVLSAGKDVTGSVQAAGDINEITAGASFTNSEGDLAKAEKGRIGKITAGSNIGGGQIVGQSIGTIQASNGDITSAIASVKGGIDLVSAKGTISSNIHALGGNIKLVKAKEIDGSIDASANTDFTQGGNIGEVIADKIDNVVQITAARQIGSVQSKNSTQVSIYAQAGGTFNAAGEPTGVQALTVTVTNGKFLGNVTFRYSGPKTGNARVKFSNGTGLLTLTATNAPGGKTWKVNRAAGMDDNVNVEKAAFRQADGTLTKPATPSFTQPGTDNASDQWTIDSP